MLYITFKDNNIFSSIFKTKNVATDESCFYVSLPYQTYIANISFVILYSSMIIITKYYIILISCYL